MRRERVAAGNTYRVTTQGSEVGQQVATFRWSTPNLQFAFRVRACRAARLVVTVAPLVVSRHTIRVLIMETIKYRHAKLDNTLHNNIIVIKNCAEKRMEWK